MKDSCLKKSGLAILVERGTRKSASTIIDLSSGMGIASSSMVMVSPLVMAESTVTWAAPIFFTLTFTLATWPDGCFFCALKCLNLGGRFTGSPIFKVPNQNKEFLVPVPKQGFYICPAGSCHCTMGGTQKDADAQCLARDRRGDRSYERHPGNLQDCHCRRFTGRSTYCWWKKFLRQ